MYSHKAGRMSTNVLPSSLYIRVCIYSHKSGSMRTYSSQFVNPTFKNGKNCDTSSVVTSTIVLHV